MQNPSVAIRFRPGELDDRADSVRAISTLECWVVLHGPGEHPHAPIAGVIHGDHFNHRVSEVQAGGFFALAVVVPVVDEES